MSLIEFIQDNRWWVLAICLPLLVIYGRVLFMAALGSGGTKRQTLTRPPTVPLRKMPPKPGSQIKTGPPSSIAKPPSLATPPPEGRQEVLPGSLDAGVSGHQKAGSAKTVKMPVATPKPTDLPSPTAKISADKIDDDTTNEEMDGLFGGLVDDDLKDEKAPAKEADEFVPPPGETQTGAIKRKASRLQELGFHHSIPSDDLTDKPKTPASPSAATTIIPPVSSAAATTTPPTTGTPETPRSSTAELTNILERIDKFLAEDTPSSANAVVNDPQKTEAPEKIEDNSTEVMDVIPDAPDKKSPAYDTTKTLSNNEEGAAKEQVEEKSTNDPEVKKGTDDAVPAMRKTQPMWARPDVTDDDLSDESASKTPGSNDSNSDKPTSPDNTNGDEKKPGDNQQRLF